MLNANLKKVQSWVLIAEKGPTEGEKLKRVDEI